jgi:predicted outer membrane repeat protein
MRFRGAVILAVLSAFAPACGGGGGSGGSGGGTIPLTPLPLVDTSAPDLSIDTSQTDAAITLALKNRLLVGGIIKFTGGARTIALTEELSLPADKTAVIDGNSVATLSGSTTRRILVKGSRSDLTLQRLSFVDCRTPTEGGAIRGQQDGFLTVIQCTFTNCKTTAVIGPDIGGGGIRLVNERRLVVSGSTFTDCDGPNGGAIDTIGTQITLINTTFSQCNATGNGGGAEQVPPGQGGIGGAVYVDGVSQHSFDKRLDIVGCTFSNNSAEDHGGALFAYTIADTGSSVFIDQSTFSGNAVTDTTPKIGLGGAVYQQGNSFTLTRSTFDGNSSTKQGGGLWSSCESGKIENCTFQGNHTSGDDTASGGFGGGMVLNGTFLVNSCTIAGNTCTGWGAGIFAGNSGNQTTLRNSILLNNTGVNAFNGWNVNATLSAGSNNLQWPSGGPTNLPARPSITFADAGLSALANNGGPTRTMAITGGPAVDAGSSAAPDTDQRGLNRIGAPDIGAFEKQ